MTHSPGLVRGAAAAKISPKRTAHESGALLVGDIVGSQNGALVRAPAAFTADPAEAERSLRRVANIRASRLLPAHGDEVDQPQHALDQLVNDR